MSAQTTHGKPPHKKSHHHKKSNRGRGGAPKVLDQITYTRVVDTHDARGGAPKFTYKHIVGIQYPNGLLPPNDYQLSKIIPYMKDPENLTDVPCTHGKVRWLVWGQYDNDPQGGNMYEYYSDYHDKWCEIITQEIA
jgi:hypothetical protein